MTGSLRVDICHFVIYQVSPNSDSRLLNRDTSLLISNSNPFNFLHVSKLLKRNYKFLYSDCKLLIFLQCSKKKWDSGIMSFLSGIPPGDRLCSVWRILIFLVSTDNVQNESLYCTCVCASVSSVLVPLWCGHTAQLPHTSMCLQCT